jgi:hypothetical protein
MLNSGYTDGRQKLIPFTIALKRLTPGFFPEHLQDLRGLQQRPFGYNGWIHGG